MYATCCFVFRLRSLTDRFQHDLDASQCCLSMAGAQRGENSHVKARRLLFLSPFYSYGRHAAGYARHSGLMCFV